MKPGGGAEHWFWALKVVLPTAVAWSRYSADTGRGGRIPGSLGSATKGAGEIRPGALRRLPWNPRRGNERGAGRTRAPQESLEATSRPRPGDSPFCVPDASPDGITSGSAAEKPLKMGAFRAFSGTLAIRHWITSFRLLTGTGNVVDRAGFCKID